jgi:hypothetical protein
MEKVCCAKCGCLAVGALNDRKLIAADQAFRGGGESAWQEQTPVCFKNAAQLHTEVQELSNQTGNFTQNVLTVIEKDRSDCPSFFEWTPGFSLEKQQETLIEKRKREMEFEEKRQQREHEIRQKKQDRIHQYVLAFLAALFTVLGGFIVHYFTPKQPEPPAPQPPQVIIQQIPVPTNAIESKKKD